MFLSRGASVRSWLFGEQARAVQRFQLDETAEFCCPEKSSCPEMFEGGLLREL